LRTVGGLEDADANTVLLNQSELLTRNYQHPEAQAEAEAEAEVEEARTQAQAQAQVTHAQETEDNKMHQYLPMVVMICT